MTRTVLHVGVGKSGTTSLQNNLFDKMTDVACLGRPNHLNPLYRDFYKAISGAEDYEVERLAAPFLKLVEEHRDRVTIISDETLYSSINSIVAQRLKRLFPDADILLTLRSQHTAIPSYYHDTGRHLKATPVSHRVKHVSFREFFDFYSAHSDVSYFHRLKYDRLISCYEHYFGRERIHLALFEEMMSDRAKFVRDISQLLGSSDYAENERLLFSEVKNPRISSRQQTYLDVRSKLPIKSFRKLLPISKALADGFDSFLQGGQAAKGALTDADRRKIAEIYGPENRRIEEKYGVPLSSWGYP